MGDTSIEWTDLTWNPGIFGCEEISPGCANCYAAKMAHRLTASGVYPPGITELRPSGVHWTGKVIASQVVRTGLPVRGNGKKVFVTSMADVFHDDVPRQFQVQLFAVMERRTDLVFQLLTKRSANMLRFRQEARIRWPSNVWAGVTVEDQARMDRVIDLLQIDAPVRFVSYEPAVGPVDFTFLRDGSWFDVEGADAYNALSGTAYWRNGDHGTSGGPRIDWVIAGGESGHRARPAHPGWFRTVRDDCARYGVPFLFKQWGEWAPLRCQGSGLDTPREYQSVPSRCLDDGTIMERWGKARAGRLLDGELHNAFPTPRVAHG